MMVPVMESTLVNALVPMKEQMTVILKAQSTDLLLGNIPEQLMVYMMALLMVHVTG